MKRKRNSSTRALAFQITLSTALLSIPAVLLAITASTNSRSAFEQNPPVGPTLGNYPHTTTLQSTDTTVTPDAAPINTTSINVSSSTNFNGTLEGYPATGVVRVTDAHPAGTYMVTIRAFDSGGASVTKMFTLTVTTPATCIPVSFASATNLDAGNGPYSIAGGDCNGDGKQDLAVTNVSPRTASGMVGNGDGKFSAAPSLPVGNDPD